MSRQRTTHTETIAEAEHLLMCGEGEHAITKALGYTPRTLQTILYQAGRHDLVARIYRHAEQKVWAA